MPVEILPAAQDRLLEIWEYTAKEWGAEQTEIYTRDLIAAVESAAFHPSLWRKYPRKKMESVFFIRHAHDCIFFRELEKGLIGVITILHEAMDIPARLKEDATRF